MSIHLIRYNLLNEEDNMRLVADVAVRSQIFSKEQVNFKDFAASPTKDIKNLSFDSALTYNLFKRC